MRQKLKPSTVSLQNYGGGRLELICQTLIILTKNGHTTCATVQVQKDAPVELLLGTDTLPQLGFALLEMDLGETGVDLLQKQTWKKQPRGGESTSVPDDCELTMHDDQIPMQVASYPGFSPCRKTGREPGRFDHVPRDIPCVVLCVVLIIIAHTF